MLTSGHYIEASPCCDQFFRFGSHPLHIPILPMHRVYKNTKDCFV